MAPLANTLLFLLGASSGLWSLASSAVVPDTSNSSVHDDAKKPKNPQFGIHNPNFPPDFADPSLIYVAAEKAYYSFSTSSCNGKFPAAKSTDNLKSWSLIPGGVTVNNYSSAHQWAPDVIQHGSGFLMAFSNPNYTDPTDKKVHHACIFTASSSSITGPFTANSKPLICPKESDLSVIDPAFFQDEDGTLNIVHKLSKFKNHTHVWTRIELQQINDAGTALVGKATTLLDNASRKTDGDRNVEAPYIVKREGIYFLTFATHEYKSSKYDTKYAVGHTLKSKFTRRGLLLHTGNFPSLDKAGAKVALNGPGGLSFASSEEKTGGLFVFHDRTGTAPCPSGGDGVARKLFSGNVKFSKDKGGTMSF